MTDQKIDVRARLVAIVLPDEPEFSPTRLAVLLGTTYETIFRAVKDGELPPTVQRSRYRHVFERQALRRWQIDSADRS